MGLRRPRVLIILSLLAGLVAFAIVQDRVTAAGARGYVAAQRQRLATGGAPLAVDSMMTPAVDASVREGLLWGGGVAAAGLIAAAAAARSGRSRRG
jgi:hypothetical protein